MRSTWQSWLFALLITFSLGFGSGYSLHWALASPPGATLFADTGNKAGSAGRSNTTGAGQPEDEPWSTLGAHLFVAVSGQWLAEDTRAFLAEIQPGGVVLRAENLRGASQTLSLVREIKESQTRGARSFSDPPFIALAPELDALATLSSGPSRPQFVKAGDAEGAQDAGRRLAMAAAERGINLLLSPLLDVQNNTTAYPEISQAAYASDPVVVASYGVAEAAGILDAGVLAAPKYFPGYGAARRTGGMALPVLDQDYGGLAERMFPFNEAVAAGVPGLVIGHVAVPTLEPEAPNRPASQSSKILGEIVRGLWGFEGVLLADDITGARADVGPAETAAVAALAAGCDAVIILDPNPARARAVLAAIQAAIENGELDPERLAQSRKRLAGWQSWLERSDGVDASSAVHASAGQVAQAQRDETAGRVTALPPSRETEWQPADPAQAPEQEWLPWSDETVGSEQPDPPQPDAAPPLRAFDVASLPDPAASTKPEQPASAETAAGPPPEQDSAPPAELYEFVINTALRCQPDKDAAAKKKPRIPKNPGAKRRGLVGQQAGRDLRR